MNPRPMTRPLTFAPLLLILTIAIHALATSCGGQAEPPPADTTGTTPPDGDTAAVALSEGAKIYAARCALCHGAEGRGDGPAAKGLKPPPRNHHDGEYMNARSDAELLEVIRKGKGAMPPWGAVLSDAELTAVLAYVRKLGETP